MIQSGGLHLVVGFLLVKELLMLKFISILTLDSSVGSLSGLLAYLIGHLIQKHYHSHCFLLLNR